MPSDNFNPKQKFFATRTASKLQYDSQKLQQWLLYTPIGREILRKERFFFQQCVGDIFGNYSLQIGLSDINLLHGNKIHNHYTLGVDIKADLRFLPFATNSIDLIICPHILEFTNNYHYVLQEFYRILSPNGRLIITCFNLYSWFGLLKRWIPLLQQANLISLEKVKNQLQTLNFSLEGGKFFSYCPPFASQQKLSKYHWLNKAGDRWFPTLANSFAMIAHKEVITPNLIKIKDLEFFKRLQPGMGTARICNKN